MINVMFYPASEFSFGVVVHSPNGSEDKVFEALRLTKFVSVAEKTSENGYLVICDPLRRAQSSEPEFIQDEVKTEFMEKLGNEFRELSRDFLWANGTNLEDNINSEKFDFEGKTYQCFFTSPFRGTPGCWTVHEMVFIKHPVEEKEYKDFDLYIDDDGYITFLDTKGHKDGPGLIWHCSEFGWQAFENIQSAITPIFTTGHVTYPTDDELADGAQFYEVYLERKEAKNSDI